MQDSKMDAIKNTLSSNSEKINSHTRNVNHLVYVVLGYLPSNLNKNAPSLLFIKLKQQSTA